MDTMMLMVVGIALAVAVGMAVVAWRLLRGERQRTEARAAMLRQLAFESVAPSLEPAFGATFDRTPAPSRRLMAVGVVIIFMAVGAASVYGIYKPLNGGSAGPGASGSMSRSSSASATADRPLELLSLSHRTESEDFVVAGLVQNPADGRTASSVMAVVYAFNAQGEYFASGKATLEFGPLAPGAESPFMVRLPKTPGVSRFRVGFRAQDGSVVAHVDRRQSGGI